VAEDLERRRPAPPALGDVWAARLLADRVEARAVDQLPHVEVAGVRARGAHLHPLGAARPLRDRAGRLHCSESRGEAYSERTAYAEHMLAAVVTLVLMKGTVTIGPLTPACRLGTPCNGPAAHVVLTFTSRTRTVRATTGSAGTYSVTLAPGTYTVTASKGMRISPSRIVVRGGSPRQSFAIDTGIR